MKAILLLFSVGVFLWYTILVITRYGVQKSISASYNCFESAVGKSYYSLFILGIAVPMMLVSNTPLGWWAGALLSIDFAAPAAGDKLQYFLHVLGADAGMALGMLMLWIDFGLWWIVVATAVFALLALWKLKNPVWWIETSVFVSVVTGLFIARIF
jgi:hypothetical protein